MRNRTATFTASLSPTSPRTIFFAAVFPASRSAIAGVSKKLSLGRKHGFQDEKQGNLFFSIADILDFHRPAGFVLENVKNLKGHDGGKTFDIIFRTLTEHLGYTVYHKIIDARSVVPQHRERIFLVGFRECEKAGSFSKRVRERAPKARPASRYARILQLPSAPTPGTTAVRSAR